MRIRGWCGGIFLALSLSAGTLQAAPEAETSPFLTEYPHLKKLLYVEPDTHIRLGLGLSPIMIMQNKAGFSANIIEVHWMNQPWDWMVFSASYGTTLSGEKLNKINSFTFRTVPKYRLNKILSAGLVLGYELISFPDVNTKIYKGTMFSKDWEPFSSSGWIYGAAVSETFPLGPKYTLKLNQLFYRQGYDSAGTYNGWQYFYFDDALNQSRDPVSAGVVFLLEVSLLY